MPPTPAPAPQRCSFCGRDSADVAKLIAGPGVYICDGCVGRSVAILDADDETTQPSIPEWATMSDEELLGHLPRIAATAASIEAGLRARIDDLRQRGVSWARIGSALSMSRQSAWERFAPGADRTRT